MTRSVSNHGIGALYGTFTVAMTGSDYCLVSDDVGKAVALSGDNEADFGDANDRVLGRLEHVQDGIATVQILGVVRLACVATVPDVGDAVVVDGNGAVKQAGLGEMGRGLVLAVDSVESTCDVLL